MLPVYETTPVIETVPLLRRNVVVLSVPGVMASLNVAVIEELRGTDVAPSSGPTSVTVGATPLGVVSGVVTASLEHAAARSAARRIVERVICSFSKVIVRRGDRHPM